MVGEKWMVNTLLSIIDCQDHLLQDNTLFCRLKIRLPSSRWSRRKALKPERLSSGSAYSDWRSMQTRHRISTSWSWRLTGRRTKALNPLLPSCHWCLLLHLETFYCFYHLMQEKLIHIFATNKHMASVLQSSSKVWLLLLPRSSKIYAEAHENVVALPVEDCLYDYIKAATYE